jgi:hypothetical protein
MMNDLWRAIARLAFKNRVRLRRNPEAAAARKTAPDGVSERRRYCPFEPVADAIRRKDSYAPTPQIRVHCVTI